MRKHHELRAWQEAMELVSLVYEVTGKFPRHEQHVLTAHLRRSAISVPSNIAEGAARNSTKEFVQFLMVARGSLSELETQVLIAKNLGYASEEDAASLMANIETVFALVGGLLRSIRQRSSS